MNEDDARIGGMLLNHKTGRRGENAPARFMKS